MSANEDPSEELQKRWHASVTEHRAEERRAIATSNSFYEKLAALSAGSIAVAASVATTMAKTDLRWISHDVPYVVITFWFALILAVAHNFLLVFQADMDEDIASDQAINNILRTTIDHVSPAMQEDPRELLKAAAKAGALLRLGNKRPIRDRLKPIARYVGRAAITCFVLGYSFIAIGAIFFWSATKH